MIDALRMKTAMALAAALLLVLAGCTGGVGPEATDGGTTDPSDGSDGSATPTAALAPSDGSADGDAGTVNFYVSDAPIEEFEHLNVTVTEVGIQRADEANGSNESGWVEYDVDDRTVDLTELQGPNATSLGVLSAPAGNYSKVFVHVAEVEGILESGEEVNVKLPSQKLQINSEFAVAPNGSTSFVFDISVFEAGNSGKYILKPVVSQSGTGDDVEIRDVDERDGDGEDDRDRGDGADDGEDGEETKATEADDTDDAVETETDDGTTGDGPPDDAEANGDERSIPAATTPLL